MDPKKPIKSEILKNGGKTYFIDVLTTIKNEKYLKITESQYFGENKDKRRDQIIIFAQNVREFRKLINQVVDAEFV